MRTPTRGRVPLIGTRVVPPGSGGSIAAPVPEGGRSFDISAYDMIAGRVTPRLCTKSSGPSGPCGDTARKIAARSRRRLLRNVITAAQAETNAPSPASTPPTTDQISHGLELAHTTSKHTIPRPYDKDRTEPHHRAPETKDTTMKHLSLVPPPAPRPALTAVPAPVPVQTIRGGVLISWA